VTRKPKTIDEYLATVRGDRRVALDELRKTIRDVAPNVEECLVRMLIPARIAEMAE
jgi:uncharacterized protein YdhG (YjbR/CyaY superfamily)